MARYEIRLMRIGGMQYKEMLLTLGVAEARARINDRVSGVRATTEGKNIKYHTNMGLHLATLSPADLPSGGHGSKLRYRTAVVSGHHVHARSKARRIREAVAHYDAKKRQ